MAHVLIGKPVRAPDQSPGQAFSGTCARVVSFCQKRAPARHAPTQPTARPSRPTARAANDAPLRPLCSSDDTWFRFAKMLEPDVAFRRRRGIETPHREFSARERATLITVELDQAFGEVVPVARPRIEVLLGLAHSHHFDMRGCDPIGALEALGARAFTGDR